MHHLNMQDLLQAPAVEQGWEGTLGGEQVHDILTDPHQFYASGQILLHTPELPLRSNRSNLLFGNLF